MNASSNARVSALSEISMFTEGDDIALADVFTRIYEHTGGKPAIDPEVEPRGVEGGLCGRFFRVRPGSGPRIGHQEVLRV